MAGRATRKLHLRIEADVVERWREHAAETGRMYRGEANVTELIREGVESLIERESSGDGATVTMPTSSRGETPARGNDPGSVAHEPASATGAATTDSPRSTLEAGTVIRVRSGREVDLGSLGHASGCKCRKCRAAA